MQLSGRGEYAQPTHTDINYTHGAKASYPSHTQTLYKPLDPATRKLTKHYLTLLQATHHKYTTDRAIATHTFPSDKSPDSLHSSNHPPKLTTHTHTDTCQHNKLDAYEHAHIATTLQKHITYTQNSPFNPLAFQIATGWARTRYGSRLTQDTVITVQNSLNFSTSDITSAPTPTRTHRQALPTTHPDSKSPHPMQGAYSNPSPSPDPKFPHPTQSIYPNPIPFSEVTLPYAGLLC